MLRQYVIVPKKPKMSPGKIASQVAHATFMALEKEQEQRCYHVVYPWTKNPLREWKWNGMCVIVLECKNTEQLISAAKYLEQWNIIHHLYIDEGYTEIDPLTPTALATGILTEEQGKLFFGKFKLYGAKQ